MKYFILLVLLFKCAAAEIEVSLKNPKYDGDIVYTKDGAVVKTENLRIQAKQVKYVYKKSIEAEGDLLFDYKGQLFVAKKLKYDFIKKEGVLYEARTSLTPYFLIGDKIEIKEDGSLHGENIYVTTCNVKNLDWDIFSKTAAVSKEKIFSSKGASFHIFNFPIFYLPYFTINLKNFKKSPMSYKIDWDKGQGPRLSMRYKVYSVENSNLFFRLDYRIKRGFGSAIESDYKSQNRNTRFKTKNYLAYDTFFNDNDPNRKKTRYRLQGVFKSKSFSDRTKINAVWDKISDKNMPIEFKTTDFELNTEEQTKIDIRNIEKNSIAGINFRPRINSFQGFKQELPHVFLSIHPFEISNSGIISQNRFTAAYLNHVSAKKTESFIADFHAMRLSTTNQIYKPINLKYFCFTPLLGITAVFYNNNPRESAVYQALLNYELAGSTRLKNSSNVFKHIIEPYFHYKGISKPQKRLSDYYVFDIHDGYNRLNLLKIGVKNIFYKKSYLPRVVSDIYGYMFFDNHTFKKTMSKLEGDLTLYFPNYFLSNKVGFNIEKNSFDYFNLEYGFTVNENLAFKIEFRHRNEFYWKKDVQDNFILDATRDIDELLNSPLSDKRNTILYKGEIKFIPQVTCQIQAHFGWGRKDEPSYKGAKIDFYTHPTNSWKMRLSYMHTERDDQFSFGFFIAR